MPRRRVASIAIMHVASAGFFDVGPDDSDSERAVEVPPTLTVLGGGGGGGLDQYDGAVNAWLWLGGPVEGALEAVLQWRAIGLDETSVRIPAELVQTAPSARPLWP